MRTRSTRLFVILLHLVGCRPRQFYFQLPAQGIVGVQPWPIVLERLDLANLLFPNQQHSTQIDAEEEEAVWLQNDQGRCLGPTARFTDCGDASLWFIAKRKLPRRRKFLQMGIFAADEDSSAVTTSAKEGLVFYVVDRDVEGTPAWNAGPAKDHPHATHHHHHHHHHHTTTTTTTTRGPWWKRVFWKPQRSSSNKRHQKECLIHQPDGHVSVKPCSKKVSWGWEMDTNGALKPLYLAEPNHDACLWSTVALGSCRDERTVHLTVVRYRAVSLPDALQHLSMNKEEAASSSSSPSSFPMAATTTVMDKKLTGAHAPTPTTQNNNNNNNQKATNLPSRKRDLAHMHASEPAQQRHLKNSSKPSLSRAPQEAATEESRSNGLSPVRLLHRASALILGSCPYDIAGRDVYNITYDTRTISPLYLIKENLPPILAFHAEEDRMVKFSEFEKFRNAIQKTKNSFTSRSYPGMGHFFEGSSKEDAIERGKLRGEFLQKNGFTVE